MPLPKRVVEPLYVSRGTLPKDAIVENELEAVTNGTLAVVVRQLSSLSRHAEDIFGELCKETEGMVSRTTNLQQRINRLSVKVTQLDSTVEEVSLQDIHMRKAFRSTVTSDQQVVSRDTLPSAMLETYLTCDKPPPLDKLNPYREDGKNGLKFYTDPNYFFDLWSQEMLQDTEKIKQDKDKKKPGKLRNEARSKKRVRQPHNTTEEIRRKAVAQGEYVSQAQLQKYNNNNRISRNRPQDMYVDVNTLVDGRPARPNSIELKRTHSEREPLYGEMTRSPSERTQPPQYTEKQPSYPPPPYSSTECVNNASPLTSQQSQPQTPNRTSRVQSNSRPSQPPPAPPSVPSPANGTPTRASAARSRESLPPPPPPPEATLPSHVIQTRADSVSPQSSKPESRHSTPTRSQIDLKGRKVIQEEPAELPPPPDMEGTVAPPPPPPPPPPPTSEPPPPVHNGPIVNGDIGKTGKHEVIVENNKKSPPKKTGSNAQDSQAYDARSDLLKAIREGIKLRKVEEVEARRNDDQMPLHDVASILARRVAIECSDSESDYSESDSETWDEEST